MKTIFLTIALLSIIGLSGSNLNADIHSESTVKFSVGKMTCATCPIAVRKAMQRVEGVKHVKVDLDTKIATVVFDASVTTSDEIGDASTNVGFPASELVEP